MNNNINTDGKLWYDVIKSEGEIHVMKGNENTVFCSIYSEPLEDEDYAKAKLICDAVNSYHQLPTVNKEQEQDIEQLAHDFATKTCHLRPSGKFFSNPSAEWVKIGYKEAAKANTVNKELQENLKRIIDRIEENNLQNNFPSAYERAKAAIQKAESIPLH